MGVFDHNIECEIELDDELAELMVDIRVSYLDAFNERQIARVAYRDPKNRIFDLDRVCVTGTATTGGRSGVGVVLFTHPREVQLLGGATVRVCRWLDHKPAEIGEKVMYFETFHPISGDVTMFATRRECKHTQLVSVNILVLDNNKDIDKPLVTRHISPFTGEIL